MNPYKMGLEESLGYNLRYLKDRFRLLKVIKNRGGADNICIGLHFTPEGSYFTELPSLDKMSDTIYQQILKRDNDIIKKSLEQQVTDNIWDNYNGKI